MNKTERIKVFDTTLRDGTQGEGIDFSPEEKMRIAKKLDDNGFHYIEGGWPGSNPKDMKFFELAKEVEFKNAKLVAFGATRRSGMTVEEDKSIQALVQADTSVVALFGKSWLLHIEEVMGNTRQENLAMIMDSVSFMKTQGKEVVYDAEHFFDGFKNDPEYALQTLEFALMAGADYLVLCDTNGGSMPKEIESAVLTVKSFFEKKKLSVQLGVHCHNDCALAVANTLAAVEVGVCMVQGTINGYGERCGNADLTSVIPLLSLKMNMQTIPDDAVANIKALSRFVSDVANITPFKARPFVGRSAFAHKGGVHVSAVQKNPKAYEHISPELVGNSRRVLVSDLTGKQNIQMKAEELGMVVPGQSECAVIAKKVKAFEAQGIQFDNADGSLGIVIEKCQGDYVAPFELVSFRVTIEKDGKSPCYSHATLKVRVGEKTEMTSADGDGPVSALDNALRKILSMFYSGVEDVKLEDFKVRVIDGNEGTASRVRTLIETRNGSGSWGTVGASTDIVSASWTALSDSFEYWIFQHPEKLIQKEAV